MLPRLLQDFLSSFVNMIPTLLVSFLAAFMENKTVKVLTYSASFTDIYALDFKRTQRGLSVLTLWFLYSDALTSGALLMLEELSLSS